MTMLPDTTQVPSDLSTQLNAVLNSAPELGRSPGLSVGIAQAGGNVTQNAQATARGTQAISDSQARATVEKSAGGIQGALDWFGNHVVSAVSDVGSQTLGALKQVGSEVAHVANAPMSLVQHEYRYLHDVEARHGIAAALIEGLGITAGAAAGVATTGSFYGAELGAEAATGIEGQIAYRDSWQRTAQASYADPHTHDQVSFGRDLVSEIGHLIPGLQRRSTVFKITSGLMDGLFDINVGGTEVLGLAGKANSAEGLGGTLGSYFPGKAPQTTEAFDSLLNSYSGNNVWRAFSDIADKSAGEIAATPAYESIALQHDLLQALGNASTPTDVADVFRDIIRTHEMSYMYGDRLPTMSLTRLPFQRAREALGNSEIPGAQRLFRATSRLPTAYDDVAKVFSNKEFDPTGIDDGTLGIYRTALFSENRRVAASIATRYANADLSGKVKIFRDLQLTTLLNLAGYRGSTIDEYLNYAFSDPNIRSQWRNAIDEAISGGFFGKGAVYGLDEKGGDISTVYDAETGYPYAAAITKNQTGKLTWPDLAQVRHGAAILAGHRNLFGRADDFAFDHVTSAIFKRWVLMSPSYALHIALAELIPNTLRLGLTNMVRSRLALLVAKNESKMSEDEVKATTALVYKLLRGPRFALSTAKGQDDVRYATDFIHENDGAKVPPSLTSGHNYADEILPRDEQAVSLLRRKAFDAPMRSTNDFGIYGVGHSQYVRAWQAELRENAMDSNARTAARGLIEAARDGHDVESATNLVSESLARLLRNASESERGKFLRGLPNITSYPPDMTRPPELDQFDEWARAYVHKLRGATTGADGTIHIPLLDKIAKGEIATDDELEALDRPSWPINVKGREMVPSGDSSLQRIANWGFRRVLNPMVNFLSREPIAFAEYAKQRALLEESVQKGLMGEDEAHVLANARTVQNVIRNVHNLTDRTQWTVTFRNWAPFYFAQEQAYRRMGRLLAEDPAAFRKYQLMISNMHDVGQVFGGKDGRGYLVLPGTGWMTAGAVNGAGLLGLPIETGTPVGMGWNLSSSSVIFPLSAGFRPDIGPLLSIPMSAVAQFFPETLSPVLKADLSAAASGVLGPTATEPIYEQMIPNTIVQRLLTAWVPGFNSRSFNATMMQVLATLDYEHRIPAPTAGYRAIQAFVDRVRMQTRILYTLKALVGAVTPVSPELTDQTYNQFSSQLSAFITKEGSVSKGIQAFLSVHPDATPFTVWQSANLTGASIPSSVEAEKWINDNYNLITKYPNAGILLMPMNLSNKYNASVYNEQIAQALRSKLEPDQWTADGQVPSYIDALYISAGNALFYHWLSQYEAQVKGLSGTMKYDASQAFWGNGSLGSGTVGRYAQQNPVWGEWFNSNTREAERGQAINQMRQLLKDNPGLHSPIADNTRILLNGYANYESQLGSLSQNGASSSLQTQATDAWKAYLLGVAKSEPSMINVITGLFMSVNPATNAVAPSGSPGVFNVRSWNS